MSVAPTSNPRPEGVGPPRRALRPRTSPTCCTSTCTSFTRSPVRRRSTGCGCRGRPVRRPDLTVATEDHNVPTEHIDQPIADPISARQVEVLRENTRRVRHRQLPDGRSRAGHRPRHRSRAGSHPAGHDRRVRRQPHRDPRRVRRAGLRHRHQRGRARSGHADAAADAAEVDERDRRWRDARRASPPRTSSSPSSVASAPAAASVT